MKTSIAGLFIYRQIDQNMPMKIHISKSSMKSTEFVPTVEIFYCVVILIRAHLP